MSETPPPYAHYPRNFAQVGSADRLRALMEGYYGYSRLFLINILIGLLWLGGIFAAGREGGVFVYYGGIPIMMALIGFLSHSLNKKIGYGAGWSQTQIVLATVMMVFSVVCYGIIGYIIMQSIASNHIKKLGVRSGCLGLRKKAILERIAELEGTEASVYR